MGHLSTVSRALDIKTSQVRKYIFKIQELNPRPLSGYTGGTDQYIVPDILMEKDIVDEPAQGVELVVIRCEGSNWQIGSLRYIVAGKRLLVHKNLRKKEIW